MRLADQILPGQFRKTPIALLLALLLFFWLAYELAQYVIAGDMVGLAYVGLGSIVFASFVAMLGRWRTGLYLFLGWVFFENLCQKIPWQQHGHLLRQGRSRCHGLSFLLSCPP